MFGVVGLELVTTDVSRSREPVRTARTPLSSGGPGTQVSVRETWDRASLLRWTARTATSPDGRRSPPV